MTLTGWVHRRRLHEHEQMQAAGFGEAQIAYLWRERKRNGLERAGATQLLGKTALFHVERTLGWLDSRASRKA